MRFHAIRSLWAGIILVGRLEAQLELVEEGGRFDDGNLAAETGAAAFGTREGVDGFCFTDRLGFLIPVEEGGTSIEGNLATMDGVEPFAIDSLEGFDIHDIDNLNDGVYGNSSSWIGNSGSPGFAGLRFGRSVVVESIAFGRDSGSSGRQYVDRALGTYFLEVTRVDEVDERTPDGDWIRLAEFTYEPGCPELPWRRHAYRFATPVELTGIRIVVPATGEEEGTCIDELEVYGRSLHGADRVRDGRYGHESSWVAGSGRAFVGVRFAARSTIASLAFGRDNGGEALEHCDRTAGTWVVQRTVVARPDESTLDADWVDIGAVHHDLVAGCPPRPWRRHRYDFEPVEATGIRILVPPAELANGGRAVDEIEVYGAPSGGEMPCPGASGFRRADVDGDGAVTITDPISVLNWLFLGGPEPACRKSADGNDDGVADIADAVSVLNFLFLGGPAIPPPAPDCGEDPTEDDLTCLSFPSCEETPPIPGFEPIGRSAQGLHEYRHIGTGIVFVHLPGGTFEMGGDPDECFVRSEELPRHTVEVSPFLIGKHEVSQAEWERVMGPWGTAFRGGDLPVEMVSCHDCREFCRRTGLRLPTEAQWEYACRAGTTTPFALGDGLCLGADLANHNGASHCPEECPSEAGRDRTVPVASFPPNAFGIHDMHGNVWERCADVWDREFYDRPESRVRDPVCTAGSELRTNRGGSWRIVSAASRSAARDWDPPDYRGDDVGFRAVAPAP